MTWTPLSSAPQTYHGYHLCHTLCAQMFGHTIPSDSIISPYTTIIDPVSYCFVTLNVIMVMNKLALGKV